MTRKDDDRVAQEAIRSAANRSLAILEKAFIRNGSGRYFVLRSDHLELPLLKTEAQEPRVGGREGRLQFGGTHCRRSGGVVVGIGSRNRQSPSRRSSTERRGHWA